nr:uncharacterized protein LOC100175312 isoform X1 [Ciona intestinalis]|eukprot:XP_002128430.2 uncharacterized protein LOC100175312 isoform X1 [Ciona intestinalis]
MESINTCKSVDIKGRTASTKPRSPAKKRQELNEPLVFTGSAMNATRRRTQWKNTSSKQESLRDSLLTNSSVEDTLCSSFESRASVRGYNRNSREQKSSSLDIENSNFLKVPSPNSGRQSFYSTSPSTDEGIVTDDHEQQLQDEPQPAVTQNGFLERNLRPNCSKVYQNPSNKEPIESQYMLAYRTGRGAIQHKAGSDAECNDMIMGRTEQLRSYDSGGHTGIYPHNENLYRHINYNANTYGPAQTATWRRYKYYRNGPSMSDDTQTMQCYSRPDSNRHIQRRQKPLIRRNTESSRLLLNGSSENVWHHLPPPNVNSLQIQSQDTSPCYCENEPTPEEITLSPLMESREASESGRSGPEKITRAISQQKSFDNNQCDQQHQIQAHRNENNTPSSYGEKDKNDNPKNGENSPVNGKPLDEMVDTQSPTAWSEKDVTTNSLNTPSRTGSTKSAIADALSTTVVATATGSVIPESSLTAKEKQKSLTERLMTVGPCDQRRVQGIVEDILCEMGEERIVQYKNAFAKFDKDSSGIISSKQLRQLLRTLGHNPSDIVLRELVNQVDMDENGKIDFNEFIIMIGYFDKANNEDEDLSNIFRVFDRHERGCIDVEELRNIWNNFLQGMAPVDEFEEMIRVVDNDGNGEINRIELLEILSTR